MAAEAGQQQQPAPAEQPEKPEEGSDISKGQPDPALLRAAIQKASARLVPLFFSAVLVAFMDRAALATTSLALIDVLDLSDVEYGLAAGVFFLGFILMQYPSVLIADLLGVRLWYGTILVFWGLTTILTAFVKTADQLILARFLLGFAEAGVSILAYVQLDRFLPAIEVTRAWSSQILIAVQVANILMGPLSSVILATLTDTAGLQAYQWVYIIMGSLALIVAVAIYIFMVDSPETAPIFSDEERAALIQAKDKQERNTAPHLQQILSAIKTWKSWYAGVVGLLHSAFLTMLELFLPVLILAVTSDIPTLTSTQAQIYAVFLTTLPYIVGCLFLVLFGESSAWLSHLRHPKLWNGIIAMAVAVILTATYTLEDDSRAVITLTHLTIMSGIVIAFQAPLDTLPSDYMQRESVSKCFAVYTTVNTLGAVSGPIAMGFLLETYSTNQAVSILGSAVLVPLLILYGLFFYFIDLSKKRAEQEAAAEKLSGKAV